MPQPSSSSPPIPRGEGGEERGGCGDGNCSPRSAPSEQHIQSGSEKGQERPVGDGSTDRPNLVDLRLHLSRFVAALPARWRSRQRVSDLGIVLADLSELFVGSGGAAEAFPPDCEEEEGEGDGNDSGPTLALVVFRGSDADGDGETLLLSSLGSIEAAANFQILAVCHDERGAAELASRLSGLRSRQWSWRPLSRGVAGSLVAQLFRDDPSPSSSLLVASDYDHTLVDDNSDTLVVEALGASETLKSLWKSRNSTGASKGHAAVADADAAAAAAPGAAAETAAAAAFGWTEAVDAALRAGASATARRGERDPEEVVLSSAASAPCHAALRQALLCVCGRKRQEGPRSDFAILSDANDVFIDAGLRGNALLGGGDDELNLVAVATNAGRFVDMPPDGGGGGAPAHRRLALSRASERYDGPGARANPCPLLLCPANLCKGRLLSRLLVAGPGAPYARGCLYLGDGANDVCPAASCLGPLDAALARERYGKEGRRAAFGAAVLAPPSPSSSSPSSFPPPSSLAKKARLLCRSVVAWSTQEELAKALVREARERSGGGGGGGGGKGGG